MSGKSKEGERTTGSFIRQGKSMKIEQVYSQIREIAKQHQVEKVVLFGSRARGDYLEKSGLNNIKNFADYV